MNLSSTERANLCQAAQKIAKLAYAPYSNFRVGAAVLGSQGTYLGTNVENASYGLSLCAERSALAQAIVNNDRKIKAIAIACIDSSHPNEIDSLTPCGACRQWLAELAPDAEIIICGIERSLSLSDLLPMSFYLRD